jgi:drug/metabolite transporter (DMT)-like permease
VKRQPAGAGTGLRPGPGELSVLVSAALDGLAATLSVAALHTVRPADLLAFELGAGALILLAAAAATRRLRRRGALRQLLLGALVPGAAFLLGDLGLARTSASVGSLLLAAGPLMSVLLAVAFLRERLGLRAAAALGLGLAGGALVAVGPTAGGSAATTAGNLLVLAAVTAAAVYVVATRRYSDDGDSLNASAWQTTGGALATAPFIAASWASGGTRLDTAGALIVAACACVLACGMAAAVAFNHGIARMPAARAAQLLGFAPVAGTLSAIVLLGERPAPLQLAGGAAIIFGLVLVLRVTQADAPSPPVADRAGPTTVKMPALTAPPAGDINDREGATQ